ncbi:MAG: hypothetical protein HKN76_18685 [Saprospiraceae bacterium]|nr:hypothetical protein [Saprospiraceae bacterium]
MKKDHWSFNQNIRYLLSLGLLISCLVSVQGQGILNRVLKKTMQKAENKVEDMLVEKASEAIAERIYKSMSDAFDKAIEDAASQDSVYQANYSDSVAIKYGQLAGSWMDRMNEAAEVPPSYAFDHKVYVEITSGKDVNNSILYLSNTGGQFAMEQLENGEKRIFLIDSDKDVTVLYLEDKKGKKSAQAIPNMMGLGVAMAKTSISEDSLKRWTFKATGKTKEIAGFLGKGYESSDGEYENTFYMTDELGASWRRSFSGMIDRFAGTTYGDVDEFPEGFLLESHTERIGKPKDSSTWITRKVESSAFEIDNSNYEFGGFSETN